MNFKAFIINVNPDTKLYKKSCNILNNLNIKYSRFDAYSIGKSIYYNDNIEDRIINCGTSHLLLFQQLLNDKDTDNYMIFEDDLNTYINKNIFWHYLREGFKYKWDVLKLGKFHEYCNKLENIDNNIYNSYSNLGLHAYIINKNGAYKILKDYKKTSIPIDTLISILSKKNKLIVYTYHPSLFYQRIRLTNNIVNPDGRILHQQNECIYNKYKLLTKIYDIVHGYY